MKSQHTAILAPLPRIADRFSGARWVHNQSEIPFVQSPDGSLVTPDGNGYDYGIDLVVRVAELGLLQNDCQQAATCGDFLVFLLWQDAEQVITRHSCLNL